MRLASLATVRRRPGASPPHPLLACVLVAAATSGCVVAVPPSRLELGGGRSGGPARAPDGSSSTVGSVRASVAPLQIDSRWRERSFDFGLGYMYDRDMSDDRGGGPPAVSLHGAFLEAGGLVVLERSGNMVVSLGARGQGRVLVDPATDRVGPGMALQLSTEIVGFADGAWAASGGRGFAAGYSHGEGSMGLYVEGAYGSLDRQGLYSMTGGLVWRLPATIAVAIGF